MEAASEEAASLTAASEEAASEDAASEEAASLEAASEEAASETAVLAEAASEVEEAAVEAEPPQAVMPAARARATTAMQIFLSFISMISLFFLCVFRSGLSVAPHCDAIF